MAKANRETRRASGQRGPRPVASLVEISTQDAPAPAEPIELVRIDGVSYYMPGTIPAGVTLAVLDKIAKEGEMVGMAYMLTEVIGEEAYQALVNCPALTMEHLTQIMDYVGDHVLGEMEGNS